MVVNVTIEQQEIISTLLEQHVPKVEVWAYGSRVKGTARPNSDLDVVVFTAAEQWLAVSNLREAFDNSDLPFRVDLFVWDEVPQQFHKNMKANHVVLQEKPGDVSSSGYRVSVQAKNDD